MCARCLNGWTTSECNCTLECGSIHCASFIRYSQDAKCNEPHLGLATTRELLQEITTRIDTGATGLDYRTVDGSE